MGQMLKELGKLQEKMAELQAELAAVRVVGSAGGGMVKATANGKGELISIEMEREVVNPDDVEMLEELVVAAVAAAREEATALASEKMSSLAGGLPIPPIPGLTA
jgi:DNA-binding YbaB/EbfC family protein